MVLKKATDLDTRMVKLMHAQFRPPKSEIDLIWVALSPSQQELLRFIQHLYLKLPPTCGPTAAVLAQQIHHVAMGLVTSSTEQPESDLTRENKTPC